MISKKLQHYLLPVLLFLVGVAAFANTFDNEFIRTWDDNVYIFENPYNQDFPATLDEMFTQIYFVAYLPITLLSFAIEYSIWGTEPAGYHVVNVLLHALNGVLVYYVILRLFSHRGVAFLTAVLFLIHPVQVESVAWITERKNTLSMVFFLLTFLVHIRSARYQSQGKGKLAWRYQIGAWWLFLVCMLSKNAAMGAPILFAFYDYAWHRMPLKRIVLRNAPYAMIAGMGAALILFGHSEGDAIYRHQGEGLFENIQMNAWLYWDYFMAYLAPVSLTNRYLYSIEDVRAGAIQVWMGMALLVALVGVFFWQPFGQPHSRFAIVWIVVLFAPVANIVPLATIRTDHYMYYPAVMFFALMSVVLIRLYEFAKGYGYRGYRLHYVVAGGIVVLCGWYGWITQADNEIWGDSASLWQNNLRYYPENDVAMANTGLYYYMEKDYGQARIAFQKLIAAHPENATGYQFLATIAEDEGDLETALIYFQELLNQNPENEMAQENIGRIYFKYGLSRLDDQRYKDAEHFFQQALPYLSDEPILYNNLGFTLINLGQYEQAIPLLQKAVDLNPDYVRATVNLGHAALANGSYEVAQSAYARAFALDKNLDARTHSNYCLAMVLAEKNEASESDIMSYCEKAVTLEPYTVFYRARLAYVLMRMGHFDEALEQVETAIQISPDDLASYAVQAAIFEAMGDEESARAIYDDHEGLSDGTIEVWLGF